jgi:hypothetical protein
VTRTGEAADIVPPKLTKSSRQCGREYGASGQVNCLFGRVETFGESPLLGQGRSAEGQGQLQLQTVREVVRALDEGVPVALLGQTGQLQQTGVLGAGRVGRSQLGKLRGGADGVSRTQVFERGREGFCGGAVGHAHWYTQSAPTLQLVSLAAVFRRHCGLSNIRFMVPIGLPEFYSELTVLAEEKAR